jgi:hypothetical protein
VLLANAVVFGLLLHVAGGLLAVLYPEDRDKVRLPMLTTVDESDSVITVPLVTWLNFAT